MRRALLFGNILLPQALAKTLSRSTRFSPLASMTQSQSRHYGSYSFNNHLSHADNRHFPELSFENFMKEMNQPEERRLLDDTAFSISMHAFSPIANDADLKIVLKTACAKLECFKRDYCSDEGDSVFKLNLGRIFDALRIFRDIFEYSRSHPTSTAQNIKKVALEYLNEFQEYLKNQVSPADQKREYYLKVQSTITKFLQKETPQDSPSP